MRPVQPGQSGPVPLETRSATCSRPSSELRGSRRRSRWSIRLLARSLLALPLVAGLGLGEIALRAQPAGPATKPPLPKPQPGIEKSPASPEPTTEAAAARPPAAEVMARMQKFYEGTTALRAKFVQTLSGPMGKRQAAGGVILKKPGKMRWDYEKPERKLFIADGTTLWVYEPEDEQAYKQPLTSSQLPAQVSFLFGKGRLQDDFDASYFDGQPMGEPGDLILKLLPKVASASYRHIVFVVNPKTFMVKETVLYDQQGGSNHIVFSAIEINPKSGVDDGRFSFTPPANTKIISPR